MRLRLIELRYIRNSDLELHRMSGFGVRPALIWAMLCETTRSQYWFVRGTVCSSTPAALHTYTQQRSKIDNNDNDSNEIRIIEEEEGFDKLWPANKTEHL